MPVEIVRENRGAGDGNPLTLCVKIIEEDQPLKKRVSPPVVAVPVAGFPEYFVFEQLSTYMNYLYGKHLSAEIYIPGAENLLAGEGIGCRPFPGGAQPSLAPGCILATSGTRWACWVSRSV